MWWRLIKCWTVLGPCMGSVRALKYPQGAAQAAPVPPPVLLQVTMLEYLRDRVCRGAWRSTALDPRPTPLCGPMGRTEWAQDAGSQPLA